MRVAIYARVSTDDKNQNPGTQLLALREFCQRAGWEVVEEYVDRARAKDYKHRAAWADLLEAARRREFKVVLVFRLDRAFRSVNECSNTIRYWHDIGVGFKSMREDVIDTTTSQGMFILHIMAAVAELESSIISERVTAGIRRTRAEGHRFGRKSLKEKKGITVEMVEVAVRETGSQVKAARVLRISRRSVARLLARGGQNDTSVATLIEPAASGTHQKTSLSAGA